MSSTGSTGPCWGILKALHFGASRWPSLSRFGRSDSRPTRYQSAVDRRMNGFIAKGCRGWPIGRSSESFHLRPTPSEHMYSDGDTQSNPRFSESIHVSVDQEICACGN